VSTLVSSNRIAEIIDEVIEEYGLPEGFYLDANFVNEIAGLFGYIYPRWDKGDPKLWLDLISNTKHKKKIRIIIDRLDWLTSDLTKIACETFEKVYQAKFLRGRNVDVVFLGCVYLACRAIEYPVLERDFVGVEYIGSLKQILKQYRNLLYESRRLHLPKIPLKRPLTYVERLMQEFNADLQISLLGIQESLSLPPLDGKDPVVIAAALIYIIFRTTRTQILQSNLANYISRSTATLRTGISFVKRSIEIKNIELDVIIKSQVIGNLGIAYLRSGRHQESFLLLSYLSEMNYELPQYALISMRTRYRDEDLALASPVQIVEEGTRLHYVGFTHLIENEILDARQYFQRAADRRSHISDHLESRTNVALTYYATNEFEKSNAYYEEIVSRYISVGNTVGLPVLHINMSRNYLALNKIKGAEKSAREALSLAVTNAQKSLEADALETLALVEICKPMDSQSEHLYQRAVQLRMTLNDSSTLSYSLLRYCLVSRDIQAIEENLKILEEIQFHLSPIFIEVIKSVHPFYRMDLDPIASINKYLDYSDVIPQQFKEIRIYCLLGIGIQMIKYLSQSSKGISITLTRIINLVKSITGDDPFLSSIESAIVYSLDQPDENFRIPRTEAVSQSDEFQVSSWAHQIIESLGDRIGTSSSYEGYLKEYTILTEKILRSQDFVRAIVTV
jgi:tetratricopeptide (TPR) repeat protein